MIIGLEHMSFADYGIGYSEAINIEYMWSFADNLLNPLHPLG